MVQIFEGEAQFCSTHAFEYLEVFCPAGIPWHCWLQLRDQSRGAPSPLLLGRWEGREQIQFSNLLHAFVSPSGSGFDVESYLASSLQGPSFWQWLVPSWFGCQSHAKRTKERSLRPKKGGLKKEQSAPLEKFLLTLTRICTRCSKPCFLVKLWDFWWSRNFICIKKGLRFTNTQTHSEFEQYSSNTFPECTCNT